MLKIVIQKSRAHENSTKEEKNRRMIECGNGATIYTRGRLDHYLIFLLFSLYSDVKHFDL